MKITDHMRYPHPVLSEYSQDYVTGEFRCEFIQQMTSEGELKLVAELALDSRELADLVETQRASIGYFLVCRRTYFNFLQAAPLGKSEKFFDASQMFGKVVLRPVIWTLHDVKSFSSPLIHKEFGEAVNLPKGSVIALGPEFSFSIDKKKFKPFESIFELAESPDVEPGTIFVDPMQDRITIFAEPTTHKALANIREIPRGKDIMLNTVYMPAVMEVVALLQGGDASVTGKHWYRVFKAKCDDMGIDPAARNQSPLVIAQKLLRAPLRKTISMMERL
ncbi:hypothetical protein FNB15_04835 [Ferrovibrio terrae]|uniref:Uncharacterized protein n=1 Tax=Ferrovibrio terrae TaxID=2594003 RepID=A0A516GYN5_9PROT|nr:hypothetical protein [Ferrovibrio terrae]QDO96643.1 hypothetical protein FNB15_04835 [Ferrovibrio terrae]